MLVILAVLLVVFFFLSLSASLFCILFRLF